MSSPLLRAGAAVYLALHELGIDSDDAAEIIAKEIETYPKTLENYIASVSALLEEHKRTDAAAVLVRKGHAKAA